MFFLIKAVFWLGLVFLLMPDRGLFSSTAKAPDAPATSVTAEAVARAIAVRALELCRDNAETCAQGAALAGQAASAGRRELVPAAPARTQDTLTPTDLQVPFGGVMPPAGSAPRMAPLPPRRPV
ncbi:hypothetical protein [Phreatobacter stygius]|uniref:DUF5330 domain-containing protein n=1 Tax=Phreatobacter stygius TaxID=1940610 RepID=A0A4D7B6B6_9HYPH|nr:hypothetical protein [Phreatobacter stygius]QCI66513.1 hypothetical protein E8M01_21145 [Phreatobacter stygius]